MTTLRRIADRVAPALVGVLIGSLLVTLVLASFLITPRPAARQDVEASAPSGRGMPAARGGRMRADAAADAAALVGVTAIASSIATPEATPAPTPEPTPEATPEPTPQPTPEPTRPPTQRPTEAPAVVAAPVVTVSTQDAELRMLALINGSRTAGGLVALAIDANVTATARAHSLAESQVGYVYHDGPDGTAAARDSAACGSGWYGENTGKVWQGNVDRLHIEFMSEPWIPINHRTNIMDPNFRRIGIGAVQGPDALYMTMVFCR